MLKSTGLQQSDTTGRLSNINEDQITGFSSPPNPQRHPQGTEIILFSLYISSQPQGIQHSTKENSRTELEGSGLSQHRLYFKGSNPAQWRAPSLSRGMCE